MSHDREELAWAAGFFDGEGTVNYSTLPSGRPVVRAGLVQVDMRPLMRFRDAVGFGILAGPQQRKAPNSKPICIYRVSSFEHTQALVAMLWHWLSEPKREQATRVLMAAKTYGPRYMASHSPVCKRGHSMTGPETNALYRADKNGLSRRYCGACAAEARGRKASRRDEETEMLRRILEGR
jgi:hypothetical protein